MSEEDRLAEIEAKHAQERRNLIERGQIIGYMVAVPLLLRFSTRTNWPWWAALLAASPLAIWVFDEPLARKFPLYRRVRDWVNALYSKAHGKLDSFEKRKKGFPSSPYGLADLVLCMPGGVYVGLCWLLFAVSGVEFFFGPPPYSWLGSGGVER